MNLITGEYHSYIALPWLRWLVTGLSLQKAMLVRVRFVVDVVTLGQVASEIFCFTLSVSFHRGFQYSYIIWGMNNDGRSSETLSHTI
jgi:hypothetical protein